MKILFSLRYQSKIIMKNPKDFSRSLFIVKMYREDFLCGVIEGYYGRPWTFQQRNELFQ